MFNFFKKKIEEKKDRLVKARELNLISEKEYYQLQIERYEEKLKGLKEKKK